MSRKSKGVYIAAIRQHVGKTSTCLGLLHGLKQRFQRVGFIKPVGQMCVHVEEEIDGKVQEFKVDKDVKVAKLVMNLDTIRFQDASPILIEPGYTKRFLDGQIKVEDQMNKIKKCYHKISEENDFTVVEGTGHTGVGSIINANNAKVASELGLKMVLIANGGIGSTFDELSLNRMLCQHYNVPIKGIIVNKVSLSKMHQMREYFPKAIKQVWNEDIPLLGVIPDLSQLALPSMKDYEDLFHSRLLSGRSTQLFTHFKNINLLTSGLRAFLMMLCNGEYNDVLFVTHCTRNDIIFALLAHAQRYKKTTGQIFPAGLILTGMRDAEFLKQYVLDMIEESELPIMLSGLTTYDTMSKLSLFTAKFNSHDTKQVKICASHYEKHMDFDRLLAD